MLSPMNRTILPILLYNFGILHLLSRNKAKYLSYSDQNGGKYLSLMNSSDNTAVAHAKLMDGESGEGMDVDADKVKTVDSKGILC